MIERVRTEPERSAKPYEEQLNELLSYFTPPANDAAVAVPAAGNLPEVWLLGSSPFSAQLAGVLGLPYAFAGHLNPAGRVTVPSEYRRAFQAADRPGVGRMIVSVPVIAADTDEEADWLAGSIRLRLLRRSMKERGLLPTPAEAKAHQLTEEEQKVVDDAMNAYVIGSAEAVLTKLQDLVDTTACQELMITTPVHEHARRCRSYELCAGTSSPR